MIAYCWRTGEIGLGRRAPRGTINFASGPGRKLRRLIEARARHAYDGKTLLVPGVPEAETDAAAVDALKKFSERIERDLAEAVPVVPGRFA